MDVEIAFHTTQIVGVGRGKIAAALAHLIAISLVKDGKLVLMTSEYQ